MRTLSVLRYLAEVTALALLYWGTAHAGFKLAPAYANVTSIWFPAGIALAALYCRGLKLWPGALVGPMLFTTNIGVPFLPALSSGLGDMLSSLVGAYLLIRTGFSPRMERLDDALKLILAGALPTILGGSIGPLTLYFSGVAPLEAIPAIFKVWFLADFSGAMVLAPLLMFLAGPHREGMRYIGQGREAAAMFAVLAVVCFWAFGLTPDVFQGNVLPSYAVFPIIIWAALRFGRRVSAAAVLLASLSAIAGTVAHYPAADALRSLTVLNLQVYMAVLASISLLLTASDRQHRLTTEALRADVARRELAEAALRDSERRLQAVLDNSPAVIYVKDLASRFQLINRQFEELFHLSREAVVGKDNHDVFPEAFADRFRDNDRAVIAAGEPLLFEEVAPQDDGEHTYVSVKFPLRNAAGELTGVCGISTDITERKRAELAVLELNQELENRVLERTAELASANQALREAKDNAESANRAKSLFLATMSHEIRTPMNGVVGMLELLKETPLSDDQRKMLATVRESAFALLNILDDILDFSKIEAGRLELEHIPVDLAALVEGVADTLAPNAAGKGLRLECYADPALPSRLLGDPVRLRQLLFNLAGNAIKFTETSPAKAGIVTVAAQLERRDERHAHLVLRVRDNGIGMRADTVAQLFHPFAQADLATSRRFGGSGLGLSICKRLVELMGGEITVASAPGQGTEFRVRLCQPLVPEPAAGEEGELLAGLTVLILGRQGEAPAILGQYVRQAGAKVEAASSLEAARARLPALAQPLLLLCPDWPETELAAWLRAQRLHGVGAGLRAIFLTPPGTSPMPLPEDCLRLKPGPLRRRDVLTAVAVAAGRQSPEAPPEELPSTAGLPSPESEAEAEAHGRLVLVVEDNAINQDVLRRQLQLLGYTAILAENGHDALALWRQRRLGLVLSDCHMPGMDGFELTSAIRAEEAERGQRTPIVAITANALRGEAERCLAAGMDDYLAKPIELQALRKTIARWLNGHGPAAAAPVAGEPLLFDPGALSRLIGDKPAWQKDMLQAFLKHAPAELAAMDQALAGLASESLLAEAHKLKSASRSIGGQALGELCQRLEQVGGREDWVEVASLLSRTHRLYRELEEEIRRHLERLP